MHGRGRREAGVVCSGVVVGASMAACMLMLEEAGETVLLWCGGVSMSWSV